MRSSPRKIAEEITRRMDLSGTVFRTVSVAGPGFINVTFGDVFFGAVLKSIERAGESYGSLSIGRGERVMVEFVSANPTGHR